MARILVVEDEDSIAVALEFLLAREGHAHSHHAQGGTASSAIRSEPPDLVLLDVMLPDISGYEVVGKLRADPGDDAPAKLAVSAVPSKATMRQAPGRYRRH